MNKFDFFIKHDTNEETNDIIDKYVSEFNSITDEINNFRAISEETINEDAASFIEAAKTTIKKIIDSIIKHLILLRDYMKKIYNRLLVKIDYDEIKKAIPFLAKERGKVNESAKDECIVKDGKILFRGVLYNTKNLLKFPNPFPIIECIKKCKINPNYNLTDQECYRILSEVIGKPISKDIDIEDACKEIFAYGKVDSSNIEINPQFVDDARSFLNPSTGFEKNMDKMTVTMKTFNIEFSNLFAKLNQSLEGRVNSSTLKHLIILQRGFLRIFNRWSVYMRNQSAVFLHGIYLIKDLIRNERGKSNA